MLNLGAFFVTVFSRTISVTNPLKKDFIMRATFGIGFYCRSSKANRKGQAPVEVGITLNGKRAFIATPRKETPASFRKAITARKNNDIKDYCAAVERNINNAVTALTKQGAAVTARTLKDYIVSGGVKTYTIGQLFDDYLRYYKKRVGVDLTYGAYRKFELSKELFFKLSGMKEEDEATALTNGVVLNYYAELKKVYKNSSYTSYMAKLKTLVKFGIDNGKLVVNPFSTVKIQRDKPNIEVLNEREIEMIKNAELPLSLARVRDCFLFQLCSGLSYIDLEHLRKEDIQEKDGIYFIRKNRIKTGTEYVSVLLPNAYEILEKYDFHLPVISNQKINSYLHNIENLLFLDKKLHTHLARHTYAYLLLNKYGVRAETTARAMGHTSPKTTLKFYANISPDTTINEIGGNFKRA